MVREMVKVEAKGEGVGEVMGVQVMVAAAAVRVVGAAMEVMGAYGDSGGDGCEEGSDSGVSECGTVGD